MRFCTTCQANKPTDGGVYKRLNRTGRWLCADCFHHRTPSIYRNTSGKPANVEKIMRQLYKGAA